MAAECTRALIGFYDKREVVDAPRMTAGIAAVFTDYPAFIAYLACDPRQGLPSRHEYFPKIAQVKAFCEEILRGRLDRARQAQQIASQLAERKRLPAPEDFPEHREKVVEKVLERLGPKFGIEQPADKAVSIPPLETVMAQYPGGPMAGLKLSEAALNSLTAQSYRQRMAEAYADVEDDDDPD